MRTRALIGATALAAVVAGLALLTTSRPAEAGETWKANSNYSIKEAQTFQQFGVYYAGDSVLDLPLTVVHRKPVTGFGPTANAQDAIYFLYGFCNLPEGDGGCAPPVQVINEPACIYNPSLYEGQGPFGPVPDETQIRGVPAAFFEHGERLEIQTATSTVVVYGPNENAVRAVADALESLNVNPRVPAGGPLPQPAPGAIEGTLPCNKPF